MTSAGAIALGVSARAGSTNARTAGWPWSARRRTRPKRALSARCCTCRSMGPCWLRLDGDLAQDRSPAPSRITRPRRRHGADSAYRWRRRSLGTLAPPGHGERVALGKPDCLEIWAHLRALSSTSAVCGATPISPAELPPAFAARRRTWASTPGPAPSLTGNGRPSERIGSQVSWSPPAQSSSRRTSIEPREVCVAPSNDNAAADFASNSAMETQ